MDEFAGIKKKKKTKTVDVDKIKLDGEEALPPAQEEPTQSVAKAADPAEDAVRPLEANADLTAGGDDLDFSSLKKKKKTKAVALDLESVATPTGEAAPAPAADSAAPAEPADDFADLVKKKKKKKVTLDLDDAPAPEADAAPAAAAAADGITEDFSDLKKKKKNKKTVNLEDFAKEIEETTAPSAASAAVPAGTGEDDDDGDFDGQVDDYDVPEGDDPFSRGADGEAEVEQKSRAELANEAKAWLKTDRDYEYVELLGHFYAALYASHPGLSGAGGRKRFTIPPPSMHRDGNKRSVFANVSEICKRMKRQPEHVIQFLFAELGTTGSVDGSGRLVIKGRFQQKQIENVLRHYIIEYVTCKTCKSPDTLLAKENRLYFVTCQSCGSHRSVSAIQAGFKAQIAKRRAQAAKAAG